MLNEYHTMAIGSVPPPKSFREPCMKEPREGPCRCWYHAVDWTKANAVAIEILEEHGPVLDLEMVLKTLKDRPMPSDVEVAVFSLFADPIVIAYPGPDTVPTSYTNGQHRIQAMIDQGVELVVIERNPPQDNPWTRFDD
jgi:hypothetical protein